MRGWLVSAMVEWKEIFIQVSISPRCITALLWLFSLTSDCTSRHDSEENKCTSHAQGQRDGILRERQCRAK